MLRMIAFALLLLVPSVSAFAGEPSKAGNSERKPEAAGAEKPGIPAKPASAAPATVQGTAEKADTPSDGQSDGRGSGRGEQQTGGASRGQTSREPEVVEAGAIPQEAMVKVLDQGVARFLQKVDTRPLLFQGRFVGWRIMGIASGEEGLFGGAVRAGDTVLRVNGRSIERPESFKMVWDSLYTARELRILLLREDRVFEWRYTVEQESAAAGPRSAETRRRHRRQGSGLPAPAR